MQVSSINQRINTVGKLSVSQPRKVNFGKELDLDSSSTLGNITNWIMHSKLAWLTFLSFLQLGHCAQSVGTNAVVNGDKKSDNKEYVDLGWYNSANVYCWHKAKAAAIGAWNAIRQSDESEKKTESVKPLSTEPSKTKVAPPLETTPAPSSNIGSDKLMRWKEDIDTKLPQSATPALRQAAKNLLDGVPSGLSDEADETRANNIVKALKAGKDLSKFTNIYAYEFKK